MPKVTIEVDVTIDIKEKVGRNGKRYLGLYVNGPHKPLFIGRAASRSILSDFELFKKKCEELANSEEPT